MPQQSTTNLWAIWLPTMVAHAIVRKEIISKAEANKLIVIVEIRP
jgi:hypothetical protein